MRERVYQGVVAVTLLFFILFFMDSHESYKNLLEVNNQMTKLLKEQREGNASLIENWEQSYEELHSEYATLLSESKYREVNIPTYDFTEEEIYLLAQCVEAEAGSYEGHKTSQKYVTQVILNRLHSDKFPDSISEVIYQKTPKGVPQFSVAYNGMIDRVVDERTLLNVYSVVLHGTDLPEYVCYFYSESVEENWVNTLPIHKTVEGTVFAYSSKEDY